MANDLKQLVQFLSKKLEKLSSAEMLILSRKVGADLYRSQRMRINAQQNPDGSSYEPRKLRHGKRNKKPMFEKIKTLQYLRNMSSAEKASLEFLNWVIFVARVHQFGLVKRVHNKPVKYPRRELLGFSADDIKMIEQAVIKHLSD